MPQPPRQKSGTWKILAIIGAVIALLCCLGAIALGIWGYNTVKDATGPMKETANSFLDNLQDGNYGQAYDRLCANAKRQVTQQQFSQALSMLPKITGHKITGVNVNTTNGRTTGTVQVELTREILGQTDQTLQMAKENGDWKVCQVAL